MKRLVLALAVATIAFAGCATAGKGIDYAAYTGEPVKEIRYHQLYNWQRSTDRQVVLWTRPSSAYMLELAHNCFELRGPRATLQVGGVASVPGRLSVNDDILVGEVKCKVRAILPIDLAAIKRDRNKG